MTIQSVIKDIENLSKESVLDYIKASKVNMHEATQERYKLFLIGHSERLFDNNIDFRLSLKNNPSPELMLKSCMVNWLKGELSVPKTIFKKLNIYHGIRN